MTATSHQQYVQPAGSAPLSAPLYGASATDAIIRFFKKYATFSGRASRSEYWWWALANNTVTILLYFVLVLSGTTEAGPGALITTVLGIWLLATFVPGMALTVRRLHDANLSGWMALLGLIPLVGGIIVLVFVLLGPQPEGQRFDKLSDI